MFSFKGCSVYNILNKDKKSIDLLCKFNYSDWTQLL